MKEYTVRVYDDRTEWHLDGVLHREDGPAIEWKDGDKYWYKNGKQHRDNGPAVEEDNGHMEWWVNGLCHREDGPAIEHYDGYEQWFLDGGLVTEAEFLAKTQPAKELTIADIEKLLGYRVKVVK